MVLDERSIRVSVEQEDLSDELALAVVNRFGVLIAIAAAFIEGELVAFAPDAAPIRVEAD